MLRHRNQSTEDLNVAQLFEALGFDRSLFVDNRMRLALRELLARRRHDNSEE